MLFRYEMLLFNKRDEICVAKLFEFSDSLLDCWSVTDSGSIAASRINTTISVSAPSNYLPYIVALGQLPYHRLVPSRDYCLSGIQLNLLSLIFLAFRLQ